MNKGIFFLIHWTLIRNALISNFFVFDPTFFKYWLNRFELEVRRDGKNKDRLLKTKTNDLKKSFDRGYAPECLVIPEWWVTSGE